jgi:hypothetical protein
MKIKLLCATIACLSLIGAAYIRTSTATAQAKPVFNSRYTTLTKCGSGMTRKEEREAEKHGSDIPSKCKGLDGYFVDISYSACASSFNLTRGDENISLGMQAIAWKQKTVEWRMANGKPFAIILRMYEYAGNDLCNTAGKIKGETLMVQGLKGFERIQASVDARTPNANVKAREIADNGFSKPRS